MLSTYFIAINWSPIISLPGLVIIVIGWPTALMPLATFIYASKLFGSKQFTESVNVIPKQALGTVCIFAAVPIAFWNSILVANSYTELYVVDRKIQI